MTDENEPARFSLDLRGTDPRALAYIRRWIAKQLAMLDRSYVENVVLVADELTANAYEHGGGPRTIHLIHQTEPSQTIIEVDDSNTDTLTPGQSRLGPSAHRGRGLKLVEQIAQAWGVRSSTGPNTVKTVWARVGDVDPV
jgi:anti-sigma regulatory factor (Ser/Thr protein kinase)